MIQLLDLLFGVLLAIVAEVDEADERDLVRLRTSCRSLRSVAEQHAEKIVCRMSRSGRWDFRLFDRSWVAALVYARRASGAFAVLGGEGPPLSSLLSTPTSHQGGGVAVAAEPAAAAAAAAAAPAAAAAAAAPSGSAHATCADMAIYDPASDSWKLGPPMPEGRSWPQAVGVDGKIWVRGGLNASQQSNTKCVVFDAIEAAWEPVAAGSGTGQHMFQGEGGVALVLRPDFVQHGRCHSRASVPVAFVASESAVELDLRKFGPRPRSPHSKPIRFSAWGGYTSCLQLNRKRWYSGAALWPTPRPKPSEAEAALRVDLDRLTLEELRNMALEDDYSPLGPCHRKPYRALCSRERTLDVSPIDPRYVTAALGDRHNPKAALVTLIVVAALHQRSFQIADECLVVAGGSKPPSASSPDLRPIATVHYTVLEAIKCDLQGKKRGGQPPARPTFSLPGFEIAEWNSLPDMLFARDGAVCAVLRGQLYVVGGLGRLASANADADASRSLRVLNSGVRKRTFP